MRISKLNIIFLSFFLLIFIVSFDTTHDAKIKFISPKGWPKTVFNVSKFSISEQGFQLGRRLFYDPILSKDSTISCASCHLQATGFAHVDHKLSHGIQGLFGPRNAPSLMNLAWNKSFMWDGGVQHLEEQAISPITNKLEMDETMDHVILKLNRSSRYKQLFNSAYDDTLINQKHFLNAITQFLVQLNSFDSRYDRYTKKQIEFTTQEINGLKIFRANCATCHTEPLFTNSSFENNGLKQDYMLKDIGRMKITQRSSDSLKFKVPTLRNIQFTQPYMHDGRFAKLIDVINHYTDGIQPTKTLSSKLSKPIVLTPNEKIDLVAFLYTLSDKEFLFDPRFSFPHN